MQRFALGQLGVFKLVPFRIARIGLGSVVHVAGRSSKMAIRDAGSAELSQSSRPGADVGVRALWARTFAALGRW